MTCTGLGRGACDCIGSPGRRWLFRSPFCTASASSWGWPIQVRLRVCRAIGPFRYGKRRAGLEFRQCIHWGGSRVGRVRRTPKTHVIGSHEMYKIIKKRTLEQIAIGIVLTLSIGSVAADMETIGPGDPLDTESASALQPEWAEGELLVKFKSVKIPDDFPRKGKLEALRALMPSRDCRGDRSGPLDHAGGRRRCERSDGACPYPLSSGHERR